MGILQRVFGGRRAADVIRAEVDFLALDVETAASGRHTICQVGVAGFRADEEVLAEEWLVDPGCAFENTWVHGLTADAVRGAPRFGQLHGVLASMLQGRVVVAHSAFDRTALRAACAAHRRPEIPARWLDSVVVARDVWPELENHRLPTVAAAIGHSFRHHSALEDARASGRIVIEAMRRTGRELESWFARSPPRSPAGASASTAARAALRRNGGEGPLAGHVVALTGEFTVGKAAMADLIAAAGGAVVSGVTRKTTLLVAGNRDATLYDGKSKSGKQVRAEQLAAEGHPIEIVSEAELRGRLAG
ncbi:exonuclease domain-containing protein [Phenylobacterium sp.]|uniref:exonuclease domain-containing protein n=1 Tax=Phenylobacterium sp. TaxID=1871053 RepID=UPI00391D2C72